MESAATEMVVDASLVARVVRWVPHVIVPLLLALSLRLVRLPLSDPDTWWHLRVGDELWKSWQFASPAPWTQFEKSPTWDLTQWVPELVASRLAASFGLPGVAWLYLVGVVAVVVAVYRSCRHEGSPLVAAVTLVVAVIGMWPTLTARPQLVSFALLALFTSAWLRSLKDGRARWWLIPCSYIWACSHGMWFSGVPVGVAVVLGRVIDGQSDVRSAAKLAMVPLGGVLAAAVTPAGPSLLLAPAKVGGISKFILEWQAPDFRDVAPAVTMLMIAVVAVTWMRGPRRPSWGRLLILALALMWTVLSVRTVTLGAVMTAPLLAAALQSVLPSVVSPPSRAERLTLGIAVAVCVLAGALLANGAPKEPGGVPNSLNSTLDQIPTGTVVLNDYVVGGWLQWRHRQLRPVIDGRTEDYDRQYLKSYLSAAAVNAGWRDFVVRTGASYALVKADSPLATGLQERLHWSTLGEDAAGYVLLREGGARSS